MLWGCVRPAGRTDLPSHAGGARSSCVQWERTDVPCRCRPLQAGATGPWADPRALRPQYTPPNPGVPDGIGGRTCRAGTASCSGRQGRTPVFSRSPSISVLRDGWPCGRVPAITDTQEHSPPPATPRACPDGPMRPLHGRRNRGTSADRLRETGAAGDALSLMRKPPRSETSTLSRRRSRCRAGDTGWTVTSSTASRDAAAGRSRAGRRSPIPRPPRLLRRRLSLAISV